MTGEHPLLSAQDAFPPLPEKLEVARALLHSFDYGALLTGGHGMLAGAAQPCAGAGIGGWARREEALGRPSANHEPGLHAVLRAGVAKALREEVAFAQGVKVLLHVASPGRRIQIQSAAPYPRFGAGTRFLAIGAAALSATAFVLAAAA